MSLLDQVEFRAGATIVVQGPGHMGLTCAAMAKHLGAGKVIVTGTAEDGLRLEVALALGVDLAIDVGAPLVVFHMGGPNDDAKRTWSRVVDYLERSLDYAGDRGVRLAVDGVWKDWIAETPESFLRLHDDIGSPSFGINFDPCYLMLLGLDPVEVAHMWKERILHAHLKDHVGAYPEWEHRIPGQGDVDYPRVVQALDEIGFEAAISIETFTTMDFDEACAGGYTALAPAVGKG